MPLAQLETPDNAFQDAFLVGLQAYGVDPCLARSLFNKVAALDSKFGEVGRTTSGILAKFIGMYGQEKSAAYYELCALSNAKPWFSAYTDRILKVAQVFARHVTDSKNAAVYQSMLEELSPNSSVKFAQTLGAAAAAGLGGKILETGAEITPKLMELMIAAPIALGLGAGGLNWALNRDITQDSAQNEALKARLNYYHSLSKDISEELQAKNEGREFAEPDERRLQREFS